MNSLSGDDLTASPETFVPVRYDKQLRLFPNEEKIMATIKATKRGGEGGEDRSVEVEYDLPETLDGLVEKFGAEVVASAATDSFTIAIQALMRRHIDKSQEEVQALVAEWVPGTRAAAVKKTPLEKAQAALRAMSEEDRAAFLASLGG